MVHILTFLLPCLAAFLLTTVLMPQVIRFAKACNCLDIPGERRIHTKITPRWGGAAFFIGVLPILLFADSGMAMPWFIIAAGILVGIGIIDDRIALGWKVKFACMAVASAVVIFGGNVVVRHIGTFGILGSVDLGWYGIPFTLIAIIGVTNAINLLDGLNGLAGGISLLGFLFMGFAAVIADNVQVALICFTFVGALGAFLRFNFPDARIFMGDTGSLFLGFSLSVVAVLLTQDAASPREPMFPLLVLILPIFDAIRVIIVRLLRGKNPFHADNLHLHHLMVQKKYSPVNAVLTLWTVTAICGGIALVLQGSTSALFLIVVMYAVLLLSLFAMSLTREQCAEGKGRLEIQEVAVQSGRPSIGKIATP